MKTGCDVSRENREEDHTCRCKYNSEDLSDFCDTRDRRPHGGDIHQCPVESIPIAFDFWVDFVLQEEKKNAREIDRGE